MSYFRQTILAVLGYAIAMGGLSATSLHDTPQLLRIPYQSVVDKRERDYFLYLPTGYDPASSREWPVLVYLHGDGDRGDGKEDLDYLLGSGPLYEAWIQKRDLPFIILAPQNHMFGRDGEDGPDYLKNRSRDAIPRRLPVGTPKRVDDMPAREWFGPMQGSIGSELEEDPEARDFVVNTGWRRTDPDLVTILDLVLRDYRADPDRVYIAGSSMGAFGASYHASRYPDKFAAVVTVVGFPLPEEAEAIAAAGIPIWAFSGGRDPVVKTEYFFKVMNRVEELGSIMRFTTEQDMFHDVWNRVFAGEDVYNWLLQFDKG